MLERFVAHRRDVVTRRTRFELKQARAREHILLGLQIALDHIDEIIELIRKAGDREAARLGLIARFALSELQAKAILEMQLQRLTGLERQKILDELAEVQALIARLREILASEKVMLDVIVAELEEVRQLFADERRTEILGAAADLDVEDLIKEEEMVVTVSHAGYVKRNPISPLPGAAAGREGEDRRRHPRRGLPRGPLRRLHPQLPAGLLRQGEGLLAEGPRDSPGRTGRARQAHRQPGAAGAGREGGRHPPGARAAGAPGVERAPRSRKGRGRAPPRQRDLRLRRHPPRPREEDPARGLRPPARHRDHRALDRGRGQPHRRPHHRRPAATSCSPPRRAWPSASRSRTSAPRGAPPTA